MLILILFILHFPVEPLPPQTSETKHKYRNISCEILVNENKLEITSCDLLVEENVLM